MWNDWPRLVLFVVLACSGTAADLYSKAAIFAKFGWPGEQPPYWIIQDHFAIETALNPGAVFGIGAGRSEWFATFSVIAAIGIIVWLFKFRAASSWFITVALGCIMAGIFGNLYDRLGMWFEPGMPEQWHGTVRDFVLWQANDRWKWPNFNIADSLLVTGAIMLMVHSFWNRDEPTSAAQPDHGTPSTG